MERRRRFRLAGIVAAIVLAAGGVAIVTFLLRWSGSRSIELAAPDAAAQGDRAAPPASDSAPPSSDLQAERVPLQTLPPARAGTIRYHARLVRSDGKPHSYYMSEATPAGSAESQSLPPGKHGDVTVDAPAECREIDFTSRGVVAVHHAITQRELERADLGSIVFEQAARLEVTIVHAPRREKPWLDLTVMAKVDVSTGWGDSIGFGHEKLATPDGASHFTFHVPSDTEIRMGMTGNGVCFRRVIPSLPAGTTDYPIDFAQLRSLRGRVVGVPLSCARGVALWLDCVSARENGLFPGMDARIALDENGGFMLPVIPEGRFALRLDASYLREAGGAPRDWWDTAAIPPESELIVEPIEPLLGLEVGPIRDGSTREERSCQVSFDGPAPSFFVTQPSGEPPIARGLIRAASLDSATRAMVSVGSSEGDCRELNIPIERLPRPRDQIVTLRLDELKHGTASLTVSLPIFASRDWKLLLVKAGAQPYSSSDRISVRRKRGLFSFTFSDLEAGTYDVIASLRDAQFHRVVRDLSLGEGARVEVDVKTPDFASIGGRVTNWNDIPERLRPDEIVLDTSAKIVDGRFTIAAVLPIDVNARFLLPGDQDSRVTADVATLADGTLAVTYPVNDVDFFDLESSVPDAARVFATVIGPTCPETMSDFDDLRLCRRVDADRHGTMSILRRPGEVVRGWVREGSRSGEPHLLAWFSSDVPSGTIVPDGHDVELDNATDGTAATIVMVPRKVGDWQPPRIPIAKVFTGLPFRFWLPAGAEFIDVEFSGRPRERVPAASIGERWTISAK